MAAAAAAAAAFRAPGLGVDGVGGVLAAVEEEERFLPAGVEEDGAEPLLWGALALAFLGGGAGDWVFAFAFSAAVRLALRVKKSAWRSPSSLESLS